MTLLPALLLATVLYGRGSTITMHGGFASSGWVSSDVFALEYFSIMPRNSAHIGLSTRVMMNSWADLRLGITHGFRGTHGFNVDTIELSALAEVDTNRDLHLLAGPYVGIVYKCEENTGAELASCGGYISPVDVGFTVGAGVKRVIQGIPVSLEFLYSRGIWSVLFSEDQWEVFPQVFIIQTGMTFKTGQ